MDTFDVTAESTVEESEMVSILDAIMRSTVHRVEIDEEAVEVQDIHHSGDTLTFVTDHKDRSPEEITIYCDVTWKLDIVDYNNTRTKEDHYLEVHVGDAHIL